MTTHGPEEWRDEKPTDPLVGHAYQCWFCGFIVSRGLWDAVQWLDPNCPRCQQPLSTFIPYQPQSEADPADWWKGET